MRRGIGRLRAGGSGVALPTTTSMEAWYRKGIGVTSAANAVSNWANQAASGAARDLAQATGAAQPTLQGDSTILFDGTSDFLRVAFTLSQPCTVYARVKQVAWTASAVVVAGATADVGMPYQATATPSLAIFAGSSTTVNSALSVGAWGSVASVVNGASSSLTIGATTTTGNSGASNPGGLTLGARFDGGTQFANVQIAEVIAYSVAHSQAQQDAIIAYLNTL